MRAESDKMPSDKWRISTYPDGHNFAFTIVHDADSAYSRRLAPLFDTFNELGLRLTVTVFPFWAEWADGGKIWQRWSLLEGKQRFEKPVAVPLEVEEERAFYLCLAEAGHEIAMHTPSETSSSREDIIRAFDYFRTIFGAWPKSYVEHSQANNLDAQCQKGSDPTSQYYNTDLLNRYGCWVWVDDHESGRLPAPDGGLFNILAVKSDPFSDRAMTKYGIKKGFYRCGSVPHGNADGDRFLNLYSTTNIDQLEQQRGVALVYNHLNEGWLASNGRAMRPELAERLRYLASKNGWFAPACDILDRFDRVNQLSLKVDAEKVWVSNSGENTLSGVTLLVDNHTTLIAEEGVIKPDQQGALIIGTVAAGETVPFDIVKESSG